MLLIGDIGGTHARLSLLDPKGKSLRLKVFESRKYPSLEIVVREFLGKPAPRVTVAAFGIAGPVVNGRCTATNLPWVVDSRVLARKLGIRKVTLLNDLVALSLGALSVPPRRLHLMGTAGPPKKKGANIAVIAAGTGLGEAILVWDGARFLPTATEGGHSDLAPRDDLEVELLQFLRGRFGHVSWERVLSGDGLGSLYDFFRQARSVAESVENARDIEAASDRNAAIGELGALRAKRSGRVRAESLRLAVRRGGGQPRAQVPRRRRRLRVRQHRRAHALGPGPWRLSSRVRRQGPLHAHDGAHPRGRRARRRRRPGGGGPRGDGVLTAGRTRRLTP